MHFTLDTNGLYFFGCNKTFSKWCVELLFQNIYKSCHEFVIYFCKTRFGDPNQISKELSGYPNTRHVLKTRMSPVWISTFAVNLRKRFLCNLWITGIGKVKISLNTEHNQSGIEINEILFDLKSMRHYSDLLDKHFN